MPARHGLSAALSLCLLLLVSGCASFGSQRLDHDQVDYARALAWSKKRQTLSNIVALRYADSPQFLSATQIIVGYSLDASLTGNITGVVSPGTSSALAGGSLNFSDHPTFTFTPTTGESFAESYIRPMAPAAVLPLAQSGVPIDLLLRITAQSIDGLQNSAALAGSDAAGSPGFFKLIHALRRLQLAGALTVRYAVENGAGHVYLSITPGPEDGEAVQADARTVRALLHSSKPEIEMVYGGGPRDGASAGMVTRSILGVLSEIGAQIEVADADVGGNATTPTVRPIVVETKPIIAVHVGAQPPPDAYVAITYGGHQYWVDHGDFDSKYAFSVVQNLIALAEVNDSGKTPPIVTIPAQ